MSEAGRVPDGVDVTRPSPARLYDYYLGGDNNFEVDRIAAEKMREIMPELSDMAWSNRGFHQRAAEFIAAQGIRQFIDIGSGLPAAGNTHEVVLKVAPDARVVYVDHDPMVAAMAEGLIADPESARLIEADVREPDVLLSHPVLTGMIDFSQPVGLLMTAVLHFVSDASNPKALVARYVKALAPGSYLALSQGTSDNLPPKMVAGGQGDVQAVDRAAVPADQGRDRVLLRGPGAGRALPRRRSQPLLRRHVGRRRPGSRRQRRLPHHVLRRSPPPVRSGLRRRNGSGRRNRPTIRAEDQGGSVGVLGVADGDDVREVVGYLDAVAAVVAAVTGLPPQVRHLDAVAAVVGAVTGLPPVGTAQVHDLATSSSRVRESLRESASDLSVSQHVIRSVTSSRPVTTCPCRAPSR